MEEEGTEGGPRISANASIRFLAIAAALVLAWWLRPVLVPLAIAWLAKIALIRPARALARLGLGATGAAFVLTAGLIGIVVLSAISLAAPAGEWIRRLPDDVRAIQERLEDVESPVDDIGEVSKAVEDLAKGGSDEAIASKPLPVEIKDSTPIAVRVFDRSRGIVAQSVLTLVLLFFLLAHDSVLIGKWRRVAKDEIVRARGEAIARAVEEQCSHYLLTITVVNAALGLAVGLAMWRYGMPNPALWGGLAAIMNFVPFLGGIVGVSIVAIVGVTTAPTLLAGVLPAATYVVINMLEGLVLTPAILGRSNRLSPVAVLVWLMLWGWLWGLAGAIVAVPFLTTCVIVCRHVPRWRAVATLMER